MSIVSFEEPNTLTTNEKQGENVGILRERRGLVLWEDQHITLFDKPFTLLRPSPEQPFLLMVLNEDGHKSAGQNVHLTLVSARDLLFVATGQESLTLNQVDEWTGAYARALSAFASLVQQVATTPLGHVLPHRSGGDGQRFLDTLFSMKAEIDAFPLPDTDEAILYGTCLALHRMLGMLVTLADQASLSSWIMSIAGGILFVRTFEDVRVASHRLPSLGIPQQQPLPDVLMNKPREEDVPSSIEAALIVEQYAQHQDEIKQDKVARRALLIKLLEYAGLFLSIGIANVSGTGVIDLAYPILAFFLLAEWRRDNDKVGTNRRFIRERIEKPNYHQTLPWETYRTIISCALKWLREEQKQLPLFRRQTMSFEEALSVPKEHIRMFVCEQLHLASDADIPEDILVELEYAYHTPTGLLELASRGIAIFTQMLTLMVAVISVGARLWQAPTDPQTWALVCLAIIFTAIDVWAIVRTWDLVRHIR